MAGLTQGRPPKAAEDRIRRNATPGMIQLPMEGYQGDIPFFPLPIPTPRELELWNFHWQLPQAYEWVRSGAIYPLARYVRFFCIVEDGESMSVAAAHILSELRQLEDRFGLSPLALARLRWEITPDQVEATKTATQQSNQTVRRLRAVDPSAKGAS